MARFMGRGRAVQGYGKGSAEIVVELKLWVWELVGLRVGVG